MGRPDSECEWVESRTNSCIAWTTHSIVCVAALLMCQFLGQLLYHIFTISRLHLCSSTSKSILHSSSTRLSVILVSETKRTNKQMDANWKAAEKERDSSDTVIEMSVRSDAKTKHLGLWLWKTRHKKPPNDRTKHRIDCRGEQHRREIIILAFGAHWHSCAQSLYWWDSHSFNTRHNNLLYK